MTPKDPWRTHLDRMTGAPSRFGRAPSSRRFPRALGPPDSYSRSPSPFSRPQPRSPPPSPRISTASCIGAPSGPPGPDARARSTVWQSAQRLLHRVRQRRSVALHRLRLQLGAPLRRESTGSIGTIAVAPSNPNIIYAGSGGGIIRPDLSTGDGMYKSTDAGATWTHLGLRDSQMIADLVVDPEPRSPLRRRVGTSLRPQPRARRLPVARRRTTFEKVLYHDEYTSANDLLMDPMDPNTLYLTLWPQQQSFCESLAFGGAGTGIFKSTDGGTTWKPGKPRHPPRRIRPGGRCLGEPRQVVEQLVHPARRRHHHVTADNDFPYRLCGGQHDSGSACVESRSNDGMITFHDWHPANIQEYGIAAPDPKDPDIVFGASRSDVTRYDRKTGQTTNVGPDMGPRGGPLNRDVLPCLCSGPRWTRTCSSTHPTSCGRPAIAEKAGPR
jgi:hypothetical protein